MRCRDQVVRIAGGTDKEYIWKQKPLPRGLLYAHALLAVVGLALLVSAVI